MEKLQTHVGKVISLPLSNIDTDMIIPAQFLTNISKEGYAHTLFKRMREQDPDFPFNLNKFKGASILVALDNFGCGSSREHAVWALQAGGIRVVIAQSFADIFYNNSAKNGLLLISLGIQEIDEIMTSASEGTLQLEVDLEAQRVVMPDGGSFDFQIDAFRKYCLLNGVDELDYILSNKELLKKYNQSVDKRSFLYGS